LGSVKVTVTATKTARKGSNAFREMVTSQFLDAKEEERNAGITALTPKSVL